MKDIFLKYIGLYGNILLPQHIKPDYTYHPQITASIPEKHLKNKFYCCDIKNILLYHAVADMRSKYTAFDINTTRLGIIVASDEGLVNKQKEYMELLTQNQHNTFVFRQTANNLMSTLICISLGIKCYASTIIDPSSNGYVAMEFAYAMLQSNRIDSALICGVKCGSSLNDPCISGVAILSSLDNFSNYFCGRNNITWNPNGIQYRKTQVDIDMDLGCVGSIYTIINKMRRC